MKNRKYLRSLVLPILLTVSVAQATPQTPAGQAQESWTQKLDGFMRGHASVIFGVLGVMLFGYTMYRVHKNFKKKNKRKMTEAEEKTAAENLRIRLGALGDDLRMPELKDFIPQAGAAQPQTQDPFERARRDKQLREEQEKKEKEQAQQKK